MSNPLFTAGTTKGGTTFLTRILSNNKEISLSSDAYLPIFRSLRTQILREKFDVDFDENLPLDDYYYVHKKIEAMKIIESSDLKINFPKDQLIPLILNLEARVPLGAIELLPFVKELKGNSYEELFSSALSLLEKAHGSLKGKWCGFNDNWVVEFFPLLAKSFENAKFISIMRDPRASMASSIKLRSKNPELVPLMYSFARCWRKHAAFTAMLMSQPIFKKKFMSVRYEDLVLMPEETTKKLCDFLDVDYSDEMLDTNKFRAYTGDKWTNYSNFDVPKQGIYTDSISRWKSFLDEKTIEFIEFVCDPEMRLFGYQPEKYQGEFASNEALQFLLNDEKIAKGWRCPHEPWPTEIANELFRKQMLLFDEQSLGPDLVEKHFLFKEVYQKVKEIICSEKK